MFVLYIVMFWLLENPETSGFFCPQHARVEKLFSKIFVETKNACIFGNTKHNNT